MQRIAVHVKIDVNQNVEVAMHLKIKAVEFSPKSQNICIPIVSSTYETLKNDLAISLALKPDVIEWRADYFEEIEHFDAAVLLFKTQAAHLPLIYTMRDVLEGGVINYSQKQRIFYLEKIADAKAFDIIDIEWQAPQSLLERAISLRLEKGFKLILSNHDFDQTPDQTEIIRRLGEMKKAGADLVKVSYFAQHEEDALSLLAASCIANTEQKIPQIALSMGELGTLTRIFGYQYGSVLSYAVGVVSSAKGQLPIEDLRKIWKMMIYSE